MIISCKQLADIIKMIIMAIVMTHVDVLICTYMFYKESVPLGISSWKQIAEN